ncbi:hypothetical protein J4714_14245 [Staphylococcus epidermidis]|nr:hypothetical protein [Staphylococcus epidermidis]
MYVLVLAAALLRLLALLPAGLPQAALHASALAWVLAFAFVPMAICALADSAAPATSWTLSGSTSRICRQQVQKICLNEITQCV